MNINLTLFGQIITFAFFVWFTIRYVWPPITKALDARQQKIADSIAQADKSLRDVELAERQAFEILRESKEHASHILETANQRAEVILLEAKAAAKIESQDIVTQGHAQVQHIMTQAKEELRAKMGQLVVMTAEKVLRRSIDAQQQQDYIAQAIEGL